MSKPTQGHCTICTKYFNHLNWHHTVPQALGGKDSLQIPLCPTCHDTLHAQADAIVAKIRSRKPITKTYWTNNVEVENSKPYLEILVKAMLNPPVEPDEKTTKVLVELNSSLHTGLINLKNELSFKGITNLEDATKYCIVTTLNKWGLLNGNESSEKTKSTNAKSDKTQLW